MNLNVHLIAAARPNFMKVAPLFHELKTHRWCEPRLIHTGQHYDANMSDVILRDLGLPKPDFHLEVGSGTHAEQTGGVMIAYERVVASNRPDAIVVVGDVNSTAACAMVGAKAVVPVIHLEAGLRSRDRRMPEEINRLVTDAIADVLWTPSPDADANLIAEGISRDRIDFVGNIMIDSFMMMREAIDRAETRKSLGLEGQKYVVVTLHRPSNVDTREALGPLVDQLLSVANDIRVVFAIHPRTRKRLLEFGLAGRLESGAGMLLTEPLGYVEFMSLVTRSTAVITDSGGVQEETTFLGIPCLTIRENTERPVTVTHGSNRLIKPADVVSAIREVLAGRWPRGQRPDRWDGKAASRCAEALHRRFVR